MVIGNIVFGFQVFSICQCCTPHPFSTLPPPSLPLQYTPNVYWLASFPSPFEKSAGGVWEETVQWNMWYSCFYLASNPAFHSRFCFEPRCLISLRSFYLRLPFNSYNSQTWIPHQYIMCSKHSLLTNSSPSVPPHTCTHMHTHTHTHTLASRGEHTAPHCSWRAQG